jgi:hypothetical protein
MVMTFLGYYGYYASTEEERNMNLISRHTGRKGGNLKTWDWKQSPNFLLITATRSWITDRYRGFESCLGHEYVYVLG